VDFRPVSFTLVEEGKVNNTINIANFKVNEEYRAIKNKLAAYQRQLE
jgi:hypothetical protein